MTISNRPITTRPITTRPITTTPIEALTNPEPDFFILGAKSYGNRSNFLIRNGLDQVREVFALIERQPQLDLYAA